MLQKILYTTILVNPGLDGPATHAAVTVTACFAMRKVHLKLKLESVKGFNFQVTRHSSSMAGFSGRPSGSLPGPCQVSYAARGLSSSADSDAPAGTRSHGGRTFMRR
jgi:hypothetical protein